MSKLYGPTERFDIAQRYGPFSQDTGHLFAVLFQESWTDFFFWRSLSYWAQYWTSALPTGFVSNHAEAAGGGSV